MERERKLELEPMRGYYRLIEYAPSGAQERALYNVPAGNICVVNEHEDIDKDLQAKNTPEGRHGQALLSALGSQSDAVIGSTGRRRMRF